MNRRSKVVSIFGAGAALLIAVPGASALAPSFSLDSGVSISVGASPDVLTGGPGGSLWVGNNGASTISIINPLTKAITRTIESGSHPDGIVFSPLGDTAYVINDNKATVSRINTSTFSLTGTVKVGSTPYGLAITPNGRYLYTANSGSKSVSVIDTTTFRVTKTIAVGKSPYDTAVTPSGGYVLVTNYDSKTVSVINTSSNTVSRTITVGTNPYAVVINPNAVAAYVSNDGAASVSVISLSTWRVTRTIAVGKHPWSLSGCHSALGELSPGAPGTGWDYLLVPNNSGKSVSVINLTTSAVTQTIGLGVAPNAVSALQSGLCSDGMWIADGVAKRVQKLNFTSGS